MSTQRILHDNGVINVLSNSNYEYQFFIKDHLGNTRVVCKPDFETGGTLKSNPVVLQRSNYYPFGMLHGGREAQPTAENENRYLYNGKEYQARKWNNYGYTFYSSLHWYDYGARFYDAQLGRWHSVDPLAEKYYGWSPYNYVAGNPIKFIDPDGMFFTDPKNWIGKMQIEIANQMQNNTKKINKLTRKINKLKNNGGFLSELRIKIKQNSVNYLTAANNELGSIQGEINAMANEPNVNYNIMDNFQTGDGGAGGKVTMDANGTIFNIYFDGSNKSTAFGYLAHELKHGSQYQNRELDMVPGGSGGVLYDLSDEVGAFKREMAFNNASCINQINNLWVQTRGALSTPQAYQTVPQGSINFNTPIPATAGQTYGNQLTSAAARARIQGVIPRNVYRGW